MQPNLALDILARLIFPAKLLLRRGQRRHVGRWVASLAPGYLLRRRVPWIVFDAIDYLDRMDVGDWQVFEYGSGGSTLYWLRRGAWVTSVEHEPAWHARVAGRIPAGARLDYRLVPPERDDGPPERRDPADPAACVSWTFAQDRLVYARYVAQIDAFAPGSLDLVLVDGRARAACLARATPKLRPGGLLILDNSDRPYYTAQLGPQLAGFTPHSFAGAIPHTPIFSQTTIYIQR